MVPSPHAILDCSATHNNRKQFIFQLFLFSFIIYLVTSFSVAVAVDICCENDSFWELKVYETVGMIMCN